MIHRPDSFSWQQDSSQPDSWFPRQNVTVMPRPRETTPLSLFCEAHNGEGVSFLPALHPQKGVVPVGRGNRVLPFGFTTGWLFGHSRHEGGHVALVVHFA